MILKFFIQISTVAIISIGVLYGQQHSPYTGNFAESFLQNSIKWREIGPTRGGRSCTVTGVEGFPLLYYAGYTGGGMWKTEDAGISWKNISDGYFGGSIGAVAVFQKNPNIIYVGEGEKTVRGDVSPGRGLWKSIDGGNTWKHIGLKKSELIGRIRIHPDNPNIVYVAVIGNLWKPSNDRGVYKTLDGGKTWEKILFANEQAGAIDLILDPSNPEVIYTSTYRVKRNGYRLDSGGEGSRLWKSKNGGKTWEIISNNPGMPNGTLGNIGVAISPSNTDRIWAVVEAVNGGLYRSDDAGATWKQTSDYVELFQKAYYYMRVHADPKDQDKVYVLSTRLHTSTDGGHTFKSEKGAHVDYHDMWIDPTNPNRKILASDGGVRITLNGSSWSTLYNQPTAQMYRVSADNAFPFRIYGGQQDWGTVRLSHLSSPFSYQEMSNNSPWEATAGGESGHVAPDPTNPDIVYGGTFKGYMMKKNHQTNQTKSVNVWPMNPAGNGVEIMKYRFNWNFPVFFSTHHSNKLYVASNYLHLSTNGGHSWAVVSPDLTRGDPKTLLSSGGPISQDNTGVEYYGTIMTAVESPYHQGVMWTGSDDGLVHITQNNGQSWQNVTPQDLPTNAMVNDISPHPFQKGGAYLAATSYKFGDYKPYLYRTLDYGKTWKKINYGIPIDYYTRCIEADPIRKGLLYAGTEWGIFVSFDDGQNWKSLQLNLPIVSVRDLLIKENKLIVATHGRGFWVLDDLSVLQQLNNQITKQNIHLFKPEGVYRPGHVNFIFFTKKTENVQLKIYNQHEKLVNEFSITNVSGSKSIRWDMRYPGFKPFEGMHFYAAPNIGPRAVPGTYKVRLIADSDSVQHTFQIRKDPRLSISQQDLEKQLQYLLSVRDEVSKANMIVTRIRNIKKSIFKTKKEIKNNQLLKKITKVESSLTQIENRLHNVKIKGGRDPLKYGIKLNNRLAFLLADQQRGDHLPTEPAIQVWHQLSEELNQIIAQLEKLIGTTISKINKELIKRKGIEIQGGN